MLNSSIWRAVLSLFYPPVIIRGKNGKNSENPVGSNKSEKRKPKSAVYRSFWASVVYFHLRLISTKSHKREMTRNQFARKRTRVRIPPSPPTKSSLKPYGFKGLFCVFVQGRFWKKGRPSSLKGKYGPLSMEGLKRQGDLWYSYKNKCPEGGRYCRESL